MFGERKNKCWFFTGNCLIDKLVTVIIEGFLLVVHIFEKFRLTGGGGG